MNVIFGVDVGGTNIKFGKFKLNGPDYLVEKFLVETAVDKFGGNSVDMICDQIYDEVTKHLNGDNLIGVGVGIPGPVVNGVVLGAQNIKWGVVDLKVELRKRFGNVDIEVLNDANAATLGEWYFGAGEKLENAILITLGTGVGGGIIVNNHLIEGATGSCGEIGHIKIFPYNGRKCSCGLEGCLEQYASATGIVKTAKIQMIERGMPVDDELTCKEIFDRAKDGDDFYLEVVDKSAYFLATGLASICNTLNPNVIMIGGGVSKSGDFFTARVRKIFREMAFFSVKDTKIVVATLANDAGIYGNFAKVKLELND